MYVSGLATSTLPPPTRPRSRERALLMLRNGDAKLPRKRLHHLPPDVVPRALVFRAGIAETHDQFHLRREAYNAAHGDATAADRGKASRSARALRKVLREAADAVRVCGEGNVQRGKRRRLHRGVRMASRPARARAAVVGVMGG